MGDFHGFFTKKYHEYGMRTSWKKHENPLNIQRFMAHEKTLRNKNTHENAMKQNEADHVFFHGFLMIMKKPWIEKLFFMVSDFMGFSWGFLNSCPMKKPWVFRERLNINGSWKMKWLLMTFSLPMNYTPGLLFMGKTETWPPWKFSLKQLTILDC